MRASIAAGCDSPGARRWRQRSAHAWASARPWWRQGAHPGLQARACPAAQTLLAHVKTSVGAEGVRRLAAAPMRDARATQVAIALLLIGRHVYRNITMSRSPAPSARAASHLRTDTRVLAAAAACLVCQLTDIRSTSARRLKCKRGSMCRDPATNLPRTASPPLPLRSTAAAGRCSRWACKLGLICFQFIAHRRGHPSGPFGRPVRSGGVASRSPLPL